MRCDQTDPVALLDPDLENMTQNLKSISLNSVPHLCGGRYDLKIDDKEFFDSNLFIIERELKLASVSGTSLDVGPDNLATFQVSAGVPMSNFINGLT
jgi:hypothetical protein